MRVSEIRIRSYRCIDDLKLSAADYMALIGANGTGKSSVLYALDWFFNGRAMSIDDVHQTTGTAEPAEEIDVEVTFADLNAQDRAVLGPYGRGATARLRRTWSSATGKEKMIGNSTQGPGFAAVRNPAFKVGEIRDAYQNLRDAGIVLPDATAKDAIFAALTDWEGDPANAAELVEVETEDAAHMFGFNGEATLSKRIRFVLVPASADMAGQVASTGRGSALQQLVGSLMSDAVAAAKTAWETQNATQIAQLSAAIQAGVESATQSNADRVNEILSGLIPSASVKFKTEVPAWSSKSEPTIFTDVVIDGETKDVARQGHGVQRAVMMAMLQSLVPDEMTAAAVAANEPDPAAVAAKLQQELENLPALIIAIEEPEIYQHPVRARSFARVLSAISERASTQVFLATHSPFFILPGQFDSLRRFTLEAGQTRVKQSSVSAVASATGAAVAQVGRLLERELPRTFSEGFFADAVIFVEGDTDRVVIETLAERLGTPLDSRGTAVLGMGGKGNLRIPFELLRSVGISVFVIADGDSLGAARKGGANQAQSEATHQAELTSLVAWLPTANAQQGATPYSYGDPTTSTSQWCIWRDDLEEELGAWPSYVAELTALGVPLREKNVAAYRSAATDAAVTDLPASFSVLVQALAAFA